VAFTPVTHDDVRVAVETLLGNNMTIVDAVTWTASTTYSAGAIVTYSGIRYLTPRGAPSSTGFNSANWVALGKAPDTF
jgi:ABC-type transporter Mla maintaining outer membrane lipid asymmetry permease subunit MlaE